MVTSTSSRGFTVLHQVLHEAGFVGLTFTRRRNPLSFLIPVGRRFDGNGLVQDRALAGLYFRFGDRLSPGVHERRVFRSPCTKRQATAAASR